MATVNEVEKFARMKSDWWDQSGQNAALHSVMLIFSLISILTKKIFFFFRKFPGVTKILAEHFTRWIYQ